MDHDHDFEWRPGETLEVDGEAARTRAGRFREVLGRYASGVAVVTTTADGSPIGMTCQSFTSVSLDPPLVAFLPTAQSRAFAAVRRSGTFAVNFLAAGQEDLSELMAGPSDDKFAGLAWRPAPGTGAPLLEGTVGYVDCTVEAIHEAGDHFIVVGRVVELAPGDDTTPLVYHRGDYTTTT
jgi:3-hydroxy-9,10-secoandrosta-1,3,5(10)-triene-9,17-dione monooxygenase reductase component